ncbi:MAG: hypothetical protein Pg6C_14580 [Treponemataceae bacterium]|nr:MAG: hypothetical protein Pg6C_14580 [Treponemataceae bacterium]
MEHAKFNEEDFISFLKNAVHHIQTEEDLIEITRLKHVFKKTVPLSRRSYVGCYFAKILLEQGAKIFPSYSAAQTKERQRGGRKRFQRQDEQPRGEHAAVRHAIDESVAARIFVSIGKNRRVFPRDLVSLLTQKANLPQDRIGEINICDNYSFVQIFAEDAEKIIAALNGCAFHGRALTVSYARKKEDAADIGEDIASGQ